MLYADAPSEISAIELLCSVGGGAVLDTQASRTTGPDVLSRSRRARPATWVELNRENQVLHLRAQRFARVQVAEMRLYTRPKPFRMAAPGAIYTAV